MIINAMLKDIKNLKIIVDDSPHIRQLFQEYAFPPSQLDNPAFDFSKVYQFEELPAESSSYVPLTFNLLIKVSAWVLPLKTLLWLQDGPFTTLRGNILGWALTESLSPSPP
jgi:hypothetical protein